MVGKSSKSFKRADDVSSKMFSKASLNNNMSPSLRIKKIDNSPQKSSSPRKKSEKGSTNNYGFR
jgi:predicted RNA-binding protein with RPS1 domain